MKINKKLMSLAIFVAVIISFIILIPRVYATAAVAQPTIEGFKIFQDSTTTFEAGTLICNITTPGDAAADTCGDLSTGTSYRVEIKYGNTGIGAAFTDSDWLDISNLIGDGSVDTGSKCIYLNNTDTYPGSGKSMDSCTYSGGTVTFDHSGTITLNTDAYIWVGLVFTTGSDAASTDTGTTTTININSKTATSDNINVTVSTGGADNTAPEVNLISPTEYQNFTSSSIDFNCTMSDADDGLKNSTLYGNWSGSWHANETQTITGASNETNFTKTISDGTYIWNCYVCDNAAAGNCAFNSTNRTFNVDTTYPQVTIDSPEVKNYSVSSIDFNISLNEAGDTCLYSLDAGITNITMTANASNTGFNATNSSIGDGQYTANFYCNDTIGNLNDSESRGFGIDTTNPLISIVYPSNNSNFSTKNIGVNYTLSDINIQACWYTNNSGVTNNSITCGDNVTASWEEGSNTVIVYANDSAGNKNSSSVTFSVDTAYPQITIVSPENDTYATTTIDFNISLNEASSWCGFSLDNEANITMTKFNNTYFNFTNSTMSDGSHSIVFACNDTTGNMNASSGIRYFSVDSIDPAVTLILPENNTINDTNNTIDFYYNVTDASDIANCSLIIEGEINKTVDDPDKDTTNNITVYLPNADYLWSVNCTDSENNQNSSSVTWNLSVAYTPPDGTPPEVTINLPLAQNYSTSSVDFNVTTNEDCDYCNYTLNDGITNYTMTNNGNRDFNATNSSIADDQYTVKYYCWDTLNNLNDSESRDFGIDTTYPLISVVYPENNSNFSTKNIGVNYTVIETYIQSCWYTNNSGVTNNSITCGNNVTASWEEGSNIVIVYANDSAGNKNSSSVTFSVDTVYPQITIVSPENDTYATTTIEFNISLNEASSWCGFSLDNEANITMTKFNNTYFNFTNSTMTDGSHSIVFACNDTTGNMNASSGLRYFSVDSIDPAVTLILPENNTINTTANTIDFYYNVTDASDIANCSLIIEGEINKTVDDPENDITNNITVYLPNADYLWSVNCTDSVNNQNSSSVSWNIKAEVVNVTKGIISTTEGDTPFYTTSANPNDTCQNMKKDDSCAVTWQVNATGGLNEIYEFYAFVNATNYSDYVEDNETNRINITIIYEAADTTAPQITIVSPENDTYATSTIEFNVSLNEDSSWCGFSLDDAANVTMTKFNNTYFNFTNSTMTDGSHSVVFACNDTTGNMNASSDIRWFSIITTIPNAPTNIDSYVSGADNKNVTITWDAMENASSYRIYFAPNLTSAFSENDTTTNPNYTDVNASLYTKRFYKIASVNAAGENVSIVIVGKQDYLLKRKAGSTTKNWIGFPLNASYFNDANSTLNNITNCTSVAYFNSTTQQTVFCNSYSCPTTCTATACNFNLGVGFGYEVNINESSGDINWTLTGTVYNKTEITLIKNTTNFGKNWVVMYANTSLANLSELYSNLTDNTAAAVNWWNNTAQTSVGCIYISGWGMWLGKCSLAIEPHHGYEIAINATQTWMQK